MEKRASTERAYGDDLRKLSDPEFFAQWAAVRVRLAVTPTSHPGHVKVRHEYDAVTAEYRWRIDPYEKREL